MKTVISDLLGVRRRCGEIYGSWVAADTPFRKLVLKYLLNSLYGKTRGGAP